MRTLCIVAALAALTGCDSIEHADIRAERAIYEQVTGARIDRPEGDLDVSWPAYLEADDRLTERERQRLIDMLGTWEQRIEAGEELAGEDR